MNVTRYYKVADHNFSLSLPDSDKLWSALEGQYGPFVIPEDTALAEGLLFSLEYVESFPEGRVETVIDNPTEEGETMVRLLRMGEDWIFETAYDSNHPVCSKIRSDKNFSRAEIYLVTRRLSDAVFGINNAAMLMFAFASARFRTLEFHASVIENGGSAFLFLGRSGTGKSTHSRMWLENIPGSTLMNDDNPVVRIWPGGRVVAYGSPWSGKTPCYKNISAPIGAFVQIRQCPENRIVRMSVLEGYSSLFSSISGIKEDSSAMADDLNASMSDLLTFVPCYLLDCRPDREAAELCFETVKNR